MQTGRLRNAPFIAWLEEIDARDIGVAGGKNAALGEMLRNLKEAGVAVPRGFATTAEAYRAFTEFNELQEGIREQIDNLTRGKDVLEEVGENIRGLFLRGRFPEALSWAILEAYRRLGRIYHTEELDVAVRSSANAEDLPEASFAGMLESFLNIRGEAALLDSVRRCFASLFTDRAIHYRERMGFDHLRIFLSAGIQKMVRADKACAGVIFTMHKRSCFPDLIVISGAWGLGESVVQGRVGPDEFHVFKPLLARSGCTPITGRLLGGKDKRSVCAEGSNSGTRDIPTSEVEQNRFILDDEEILRLARWATAVEERFGRPMDLEWAKDGETQDLWIVQARPLTGLTQCAREEITLCRLLQSGRLLARGISIGEGIASGRATFVETYRNIQKVSDHSILVSEIANTGWVSILRQKNIKGIITDFGGPNSHAAILCRELDVPGIVGTGNGTEVLRPDQEITMASIEGDHGYIYDGRLAWQQKTVRISGIASTRTKVLLNIPSPAAAFQWWRLPADGIGMIRLDYILKHITQIHPMALIRFGELKNRIVLHQIAQLTRGYNDKRDFFLDTLSHAIAEIAASRHPAPVILRTSNMAVEEYLDLVGAKFFEPDPQMVPRSYRGVERYLDDRYVEAFALECEAFRRAREEKGLQNLHLMLPYCGSTRDARRIIDLFRENGIRRGAEGLEFHLACDLPANLRQVKEFAEYFDAFSLSVNKLRQLHHALRASAGLLAEEESESSESSLRDGIEAFLTAARAAGRPVALRSRTFVGSNHLVKLFLKAGLAAFSVNPEGFPELKSQIAAVEGHERNHE
ncbi:Phosphoenolpyruvate synthase [uncultured Desulfatiglans sp.]|nr:Phosphoenolpyruvate synthase [uncultured Desulfatiglans sp.]